MLGMTLYLTQAATKIRCCTGVCWKWQYVSAHGNGIGNVALGLYLCCYSLGLMWVRGLGTKSLALALGLKSLIVICGITYVVGIYYSTIRP